MTADEIMEGTRVATAHIARLSSALGELASEDGAGNAVPMGTEELAGPQEPDPAAFANVERLGEFWPAAHSHLTLFTWHWIIHTLEIQSKAVQTKRVKNKCRA